MIRLLPVILCQRKYFVDPATGSFVLPPFITNEIIHRHSAFGASRSGPVDGSHEMGISAV
ncbi:hypothetical protein [Candidatus Villigracilis saccharophilus]|uniref:hypothetical protein n=1 Tax=Candidatus Villigracilis saccharophilus TaxID=3140684 RepID=UPI0031EA6B56